MKLEKYLELPLVDTVEGLSHGQVVWVGHRSLIPSLATLPSSHEREVILNQEAAAEKFIVVGSCATEGYIRACPVLGLFSDDDTAMGLGLPSMIIFNESEEVRLDGGRWDEDAIVGGLARTNTPR